MSSSLYIVYRLLIFSILLAYISLSDPIVLNADDIEYETLPDPSVGISILENSCVGKPNGYHYLKLADQRTVSSFASTLAHSDDSSQNYNNKKYPVVRVKCDNEYIILNLHQEPELREYFTSFLKWQSFVSGPSNTHVVNWEQWYLPNEELNKDEQELDEYIGKQSATSYIISPDCSSCDIKNHRQIHNENTVYMMTGTMFGCFWRFLGEHNFDEDLQSQQCFFNPSYDRGQMNLNEMGELTPFALDDRSSIDDWDHSGVCAFNVRQSNFKILSQTHDMCTVDFSGEDEFNMEMGYHLKPSIGIDGKHCVCVKPSKKKYFQIATSELQAAQQRNQNFLKKQKQDEYKQELEDELKKDDIMNVPTDKIIYLYQSDFEHGTYRIRESGTYIVMEDIIFDFNAGDINDPLHPDAWWPKGNQHKIYPGAKQYRDPYFLGFWAGITIETNNVILDLNSHSLAMSDAFYYHQRWFTTIALQSQYFLPGQVLCFSLSLSLGFISFYHVFCVQSPLYIMYVQQQGPGFFGATPTFAEHIIIRNGVLGQSSHHNIHGHYNHDVTIEDIHCRDFETHGIQFNGFDGITLKNIEIGPSSTKVFLHGSFGHARFLLPRLQQIAKAMDEDDEYFSLREEDKKIKFYGRDNAVSIQDIHDDLKLQLESVFKYVMTDELPIFNDKLTEEKWQQALDTFYNPSGLPHGAGMYGIFLNTVGASVLTYNLQTSTYSNNAVIHNINIHDLKHQMTEFIRMGVPNSGSIYLNALHGCLDARNLLDNIEDIGNDGYQPRYKGNILTDATIAMEYFSNNWDILQASLIWHDRLFPWSMGEDLDALNDFNIGCNGDAQVHAAKGLTGIRVDGVNDLHLKDITIKDISEITPPGTNLCGQYSSFERDCVGKCGGHIRQKEPMQVGFSGHNLQGICLNAAKNVKVGKTNIHNLQSLYGLTFGISIWPSVDIEFEEKVFISNLLAGVDYQEIMTKDDNGNIIFDDDFEENNYPNRIPEVCGIRVVDEYYSDTADKIYKSTVKFAKDTTQNDVLIANVDGYKTCYVDVSVDDYYDNNRPPKYSMIGIWKGHDTNFKGIGEYGIMNQQRIIKHQHLQNTKLRNKIIDWFNHNFKQIVFGLTIFLVIFFAIFIKKFCSKNFWIKTSNDFEEIQAPITRLHVHGGRVIFLPQQETNQNNQELTPLLE